MPRFQSDDTDVVDVLIIGAGQSGLAAGYHLARRGASFLMLDAGPEVGHAWRSRWDSLRLFSPAEYDALPGLPFPAAPGSHPGKDDVADYLRDYARAFDLPVRLASPVSSMRREQGLFTASTPTGEVRARQVIVATGPFQKPHIPATAANLDPRVRQLHSSGYRNPGQLDPGSRVLVVGGANSGLQIAAELAASHTVTVAIGSRPTQLPQRVLGRDLFSWLDDAGFFTLPAGHRLARRLRDRGDLVIGSRTSTLRRRGVDIRPRLAGFTGSSAHFTDGSAAEVDGVVWATGYRADHRWLEIPGVVTAGTVHHQGGVTDVPGLYFLGLPWQSCRGSALLGFVGRDAETIVDRITAHAPARENPAIVPVRTARP